MKAKVLVVDDEKTARKSLVEILRLEGYQVTSAETGEEALRHLNEETFDLMLLDIRMPGMDGLEVLRQANGIAPDCKVILLTAHGSLETAIEALRQGAHDYLLKPAAPDEIIGSVARAVDEHSDTARRHRLIEQLEASIRQLKNVEGLERVMPAPSLAVTLSQEVNLDLDRREIWFRDLRVSLTPTEGKLLKVLIENRSKVLSHRDLVLLVQGYKTSEWEAPEILRPLVSRLRRKLARFPGGEDWIQNVRGTGYVFEETEPSQSRNPRPSLGGD